MKAIAVGTVQKRHLPPLDPSRPLRVWVPACAAGEDAYSAAIGILDALGRRWREVPLCVFATDSDQDALYKARAGRYSARAVHAMSPRAVARFFVQEPPRLRVRQFVRTLCRFAHHHLSQNPPFSRLNLVVARRTLAPLGAPARKHALRIFHAAMAPDGVLLDASGAAADAPELFSPIGRGKAAFLRRGSPPSSGLVMPESAGIHARLRESEERFRVLFSRVEDAVLLQDNQTRRIIQANEAAERLFKSSLPGLLGLDAKTLLVRKKDSRRRSGERRSKSRPFLPQFRRPDGTTFPADSSTAFLMLQGRPCTLWTLRDATPRLRADSGRRSKLAQDAFVDDVVHELRTPLSVIQGSAQTLRRGVRGTRARSSLLDFIESHTLRMGLLVDRLLELSAAGASKRGTKPSRVLLAEVLWELFGAFEPLAKRRGIVLKVEVPQDLAVMADRADLPHVFGNLIDNAIKFSPKGGKVTVSARAVGREGIVSVKDSGGGIAPGDLIHVFERFFRAERTRRTKGTGLGLAIVHGIVKANQGRVYAENDPAGGAVFSVALPRPSR